MFAAHGYGVCVLQPKYRRNIFCVPSASKRAGCRENELIYIFHVCEMAGGVRDHVLHCVINTINTWGEKWRVKGKGSGNCDQKTKSIRDSVWKIIAISEIAKWQAREYYTRTRHTPVYITNLQLFYNNEQVNEGSTPSPDLIFSTSEK